VINGFSDLIIELPGNSAVIIAAMVEIDGG